MNKKVILWDFDGVIMDSNAVRESAFRFTLVDFEQKEVDALITYHRKNGGLSRYHKLAYFNDEILGYSPNMDFVNSRAKIFSQYVMENMVQPELLIADSFQFISMNYERFSFHIVSGSDHEELNLLCKLLTIDHYFHSIHGSPTPKTELVERLLDQYSQVPKSNIILIGDSVNDFDAAKKNGLHFYGFNNQSIKTLDSYIDTFRNFDF